MARSSGVKNVLVHRRSTGKVFFCGLRSSELKDTVSFETFYASAIWLEEEIFCFNEILQTVWLVPTRFACQRFLNDPHSLSGDVVPGDKCPKEVRSEKNEDYRNRNWHVRLHKARR